LLHGYTDSADTWRPVLEQLARRGRAAVAVDLPYHGAAGLPSAPPSLPKFDEFVTAATQYADTGDGVIIVGNSLGALLAVRAAHSQLPGLNGVLALGTPGSVISPALRALPRFGPVIARAVSVVPLPSFLLSEAAGWVYWLACTGGKASALARRTYSSHLNRTRLSRLIELGARVVPEIERAPRLGALSVPAILWWGSRDFVCPARGAEAFTGVGQIVLEPGGPHCPQLANPDLVLSLLDRLETQIASAAAVRGKSNPA